MIRLISIGWDTGLATAFTRLDVHDEGCPRYHHGAMVRVGHKVTLSRPKTSKAGRVTTQKTIIDDDDLGNLQAFSRCLLADTLEENPGTRIVLTVERVCEVFSRARFGASMATGIANAQWIAGEIASAGRELLGSANVRTVQQEDWRKALFGAGSISLMFGAASREKGEDEDDAIARLIPLAIDGWPASSNNHVRDAAGVALWGVRRAHMISLRDRLNGYKPIFT